MHYLLPHMPVLAPPSRDTSASGLAKVLLRCQVGQCARIYLQLVPPFFFFFVSSFTSRFAAKLQCQHTRACVRAHTRSCTSTQFVPAGARPTWQAIPQAALQVLTKRVLTQMHVQDGSGRPRQRQMEPTLCVHCSCTCSSLVFALM